MTTMTAIYLWFQTACSLYFLVLHAIVLRHARYPRHDTVNRTNDLVTVAWCALMIAWALVIIFTDGGAR